jgi:succinate dehydrogenase/fumarate reductase flavoprotein subunit
MLNYMAQEGIDVRKHRVEFRQYEPFLIGGRGIEINENAETNIAGLYAAGDEVGNFRADLSGAATYGWIAGSSAANRAKKIKHYAEAEKEPLVGARIDFYSQILSRPSGPGWKEANLTLQQIMEDYAGVDVRSETLLSAGLKYLRDLRQKVLSSLSVVDSHTFMRGMETLDLMDCAEVIFLGAFERKETRGMHRRTDFPFTNPLLQDKFLTVWREGDQVRTAWRSKQQ